MGKNIKYENYRVEVIPAEQHYIIRLGKTRTEHEIKLDDAQKVAESIKRHVDDIEDVNVEVDASYVCEHCGEPWTEDSDTFNEGCCDEDLKHAPEEPEEDEDRVITRFGVPVDGDDMR